MIGGHLRKRCGLTDWASAQGVGARPRPRQFPGEARFSATTPVFEVSTTAHLHARLRRVQRRPDTASEFELHVPDGTPESEVTSRENAEASAAAKLVDEGHLIRVWKRLVAPGDTKILGLYRADSESQLDGLLGALPLYPWMHVTVIPLEPHPHDPAAAKATT